jgi:dTDP-4-dehydrorhamnose reductase
MITILLTGSTGQIGWELTRTLMPLGRVVAPGENQLNLAQPESLGAFVNTMQPDVIVNAAAYTAVDKAEQEPGLALAINGAAPGELAKAARRYNALLVHYSTDYVFDGNKPGAYSEENAPNPISVYGRSKLAGDEAIRASGVDHLIFRTSWVFASRGKNFLTTILRAAGELEELRVVADQFGAPTWARLIAEVTTLALQQELTRRKSSLFKSNTFNLTAAGETSWHGFATRRSASSFKHSICWRAPPPCTTWNCRSSTPAWAVTPARSAPRQRCAPSI